MEFFLLQAQQLNSLLDAQENQQGSGNIGNLGNNLGNNIGGGGGNNNMRKNFDGPQQNRNFQGGMGGGNMVSYFYFFYLIYSLAVLRLFLTFILFGIFLKLKRKIFDKCLRFISIFVLSISIRLGGFFLLLLVMMIYFIHLVVRPLRNIKKKERFLKLIVDEIEYQK